jgi:hypothetical protein
VVCQIRAPLKIFDEIASGFTVKVEMFCTSSKLKRLCLAKVKHVKQPSCDTFDTPTLRASKCRAAARTKRFVCGESVALLNNWSDICHRQPRRVPRVIFVVSPAGAH